MHFLTRHYFVMMCHLTIEVWTKTTNEDQAHGISTSFIQPADDCSVLWVTSRKTYLTPRCASNGVQGNTFIGQYHRLLLVTTYCPLSARHVQKIREKNRVPDWHSIISVTSKTTDITVLRSVCAFVGEPRILGRELTLRLCIIMFDLKKTVFSKSCPNLRADI